VISFFKFLLCRRAQGGEPLLEIGLGGDEGKIALRPQTGGWGIANRRRFVTGLPPRFRWWPGEPGEERQLGGG